MWIRIDCIRIHKIWWIRIQPRSRFIKLPTWFQNMFQNFKQNLCIFKLRYYRLAIFLGSDLKIIISTTKPPNICWFYSFPFAFPSFYSKILTQFKTLFIVFLQQKQGSQSNMQTKHVSIAKIMKLPLVIWRFEGEASNFWRRGEVVVRMLRTWVKNPRWRPLADYDNQLIRSGDVKWVNWPQN